LFPCWTKDFVLGNESSMDNSYLHHSLTICSLKLLFLLNWVQCKGVGTAGATGTLAPAMLKPQGQNYLFGSTICQVYHLVTHSFA